MEYLYSVFAYNDLSTIEVWTDQVVASYRHDYEDAEEMKKTLRKLRDGIESLDELEDNQIAKLGILDDEGFSATICENNRIFFDMHNGKQMQAVLEVMISEKYGISFEALGLCWVFRWKDGRICIVETVDAYLALINAHAHTVEEVIYVLEELQKGYEKRVSLVFNGDYDLAEKCIKRQLDARLYFFIMMSTQENEVLSRRVSGWSNSMVCADLQISKAAASNAFSRARDNYISAANEIPKLVDGEYHYYLNLIRNAK